MLKLLKIRFLLLSLLITFLFSGCSKKDEPLKVSSISDTTVYNFLNQVIPLEKEYFQMNVFIDSIERAAFEKIEERDVHLFFKVEDSVFAVSQINSSEELILNKNLLKNVRIETFNEDEFYNKRRSQIKEKIPFEEVGFNYFRRPIFTSDLSGCLFVFGFYCGGTFGKGKKAFYRRENGKWIFSQSIFEYVS